MNNISSIMNICIEVERNVNYTTAHISTCPQKQCLSHAVQIRLLSHRLVLQGARDKR